MPDDDDDDIELLQQLIGHGGTQAFSLVPMALKKVIVEQQWKNRCDKDGKPFVSFEAFVTHRLWQGLETSMDDLRVYCRKFPDVVALILAQMEPGPGHGGNRTVAEQVDNINLRRGGGTSAIYTLKRLKRDRPDLFQQVLGSAATSTTAGSSTTFTSCTAVPSRAGVSRSPATATSCCDWRTGERWATAKKKKLKPTWRITLIRKRGERLGTVEAATEAEAIKVAIWTRGISEPERQRRLVAQRLDS